MTPASLPLQTFLRRPGLLQDLDAFCQARGYAGLVAMMISFNERNEPSRQLAVYSRCETLQSAVSGGGRAPQNLSTGVWGSSQLQRSGSPRKSLILEVLGGSQATTLPPLQVCQALEEATAPSLHLQPLLSPWSCVSTYAQGNALASRKKVLPVLRAALGGPGAARGPEEEVVLPPTPMNSLVEECPLAQAVPPLCPQDVLERVSRIAAGQPPGSPK